MKLFKGSGKKKVERKWNKFDIHPLEHEKTVFPDELDANTGDDNLIDSGREKSFEEAFKAAKKKARERSNEYTSIKDEHDVVDSTGGYFSAKSIIEQRSTEENNDENDKPYKPISLKKSVNLKKENEKNESEHEDSEEFADVSDSSETDSSSSENTLHDKDEFGIGYIKKRINIKKPVISIPSENETSNEPLNSYKLDAENGASPSYVSEDEENPETSVILDNAVSSFDVSPDDTNETWFREIDSSILDQQENKSEDATSPNIITDSIKKIKEHKSKYFLLRDTASDVTFKSLSDETKIPDKFFDDKKAASKLRKNILMERRELFISMSLSIILEIVLIWLSLGTKFPSVVPSIIVPKVHPTVYVFVTFIVFALLTLSSRLTILSGFNEAMAKKPGVDAAVTVGAAISVLHMIILMFCTTGVSSGELFPYAAVAGLCMTVNTTGKYIFISRVLTNYEYIINYDEKYTMLHIEDDNESIRMGDGIVSDVPVIGYPVKAKSISGYIDSAKSETPSEKLTKKYILYLWCASTFIGIISMFTQKSFIQGFSSITLLFLMSIPLNALLIANIPLKRFSKHAAKGEAMISGYEAVKHNADMNSIILEASQLFSAKDVTLHGIKTFGGTGIDEAIFCTAAVIYAADSPMKFIFDSMLDGKSEILPNVEHLVYEEKLGLSAWVNNKRVLVGGTSLMRHHGVQCNTREYEGRYNRDGKKIVYLAIDGVLSAVFVVSYRANRKIARRIQNIVDAGIGILVSSTDYAMSSDYLCDIFDIPYESLKVLAADASRMYMEELKKNTDCISSADVIFNGSAVSFMDSVLGLSRMNMNIRIATLLQCAAVILGIVLIMTISLISGLSGISSLNVIIFETVWMIIINIAANIEKDILDKYYEN